MVNKEFNKKELDIINFNKEFEEKDKVNKKKIIKKTTDYNEIDTIILLIRKSFYFIIDKIISFSNPINDILKNKELTKGTIYLLFFLGITTMLLSGI